MSRLTSDAVNADLAFTASGLQHGPRGFGAVLLAYGGLQHGPRGFGAVLLAYGGLQHGPRGLELCSWPTAASSTAPVDSVNMRKPQPLSWVATAVEALD